MPPAVASYAQVVPGNQGLGQSHKPPMAQILASKSFSCSMSNNSTHSTQGKGQRGDMLIHFPRAHTAPPVGRLRLPGSGRAGCCVFGSCGGVSQLHPCSGKVQRPAENARLCSSVSTLPFCSCHQRQSVHGDGQRPMASLT